MNLSQPMKALLQQGARQGSRSTVMQPLTWLLALLMAGLLTSVGEKAPPWLTGLLAAFVVLAVLVYVYSYLHCLHDPAKLDALRSERFAIQKLIVQSRVFGDDLSGVFEVEIDEQGQIPSAASEGAQRKLEPPTTQSGPGGKE